MEQAKENMNYTNHGDWNQDVPLEMLQRIAGADGFEAGGLEDDATMRLLTGRNQKVGAISKTHLDVTARAFHTGTKPEQIIAADWRYRPRMHELEYDLADMYVRRRSVTHNRYLHGYKNQLLQLEQEIEAEERKLRLINGTLLPGDEAYLEVDLTDQAQAEAHAKRVIKNDPLNSNSTGRAS